MLSARLSSLSERVHIRRRQSMIGLCRLTPLTSDLLATAEAEAAPARETVRRQVSLVHIHTASNANSMHAKATPRGNSVVAQVPVGDKHAILARHEFFRSVSAAIVQRL